MWSLCKKEFRQFFSNLTGYLAIGLFLLLNGLFLFVFSSFNVLDFGYASLENYFTIAPYVLLILIPAITMRQISDEWKGGTMEILQTSPLGNLQIIGGKYLAALLVAVIAILPTITYAVSISLLSPSETVLDKGAWLGSYLGLFLLCGVFCAIGLLAGSFSQNSVVSFLTGAVVCFLFYQGFDAISSLPIFKHGSDFYLQQAGLAYHYQSISKGVIAVNDFIYFISLIVLLLYFTIERISKNQSTQKKTLPFFKPAFKNIFLIALFLFANALTSFIRLKADLTDDGRYSLTPATKKLLQNLEDPVQVDILLTGELPAVFKKLQGSTTDLLNEMKGYAGSNLTVRFITPASLIPTTLQQATWEDLRDSLRSIGIPVDSLLQEQPDLVKSFKQEYVSDSLKNLGIMPYNLQVQQNDETSSQRLVYPAALVSSEGKTIAIDLLTGKTEYTRDPLSGRLVNDDARSIGNAEALLEFKFASAIGKITQKQKPAIGYLIGNGEPTGPETQKLV
jgi:ABC-2 type transport system permease protein